MAEDEKGEDVGGLLEKLVLSNPSIDPAFATTSSVTNTSRSAAEVDAQAAEARAEATLKPAAKTSLAAATGLSDETLRQYCIRSSAGHPFLVLSFGANSPFVRSVPVCPPETFKAVSEGVLTWLEAVDNLVLLTDFEGEQPGLGGEMSVAQFMLTNLVVRGSPSGDRLELRPEAESTTEMGLLVDMRDVEGAAVVARIMTAPNITKLIWGADADLMCLRHKKPGHGGIGVASRSVVDVQLVYSSPSFRLGMAKALNNVPVRLLRGIPDKDTAISYRPRLENRRCMPFPLSLSAAKYAVDDLHRIEAILRSRTASIEDLRKAATETDKVVVRLELPSFPLEWIGEEMRFYAKKYGEQKLIKQVETYRGVLFIEKEFAGTLSVADMLKVQSYKQTLGRGLKVRIPEDLSFSE